MRQGICCAGLLALIASAATAQAGETAPTFDVASVKPAAPTTPGRIMVRMSGGPGSPDPGQITYTNVSMKNLLMAAYDVKGYQLSGPGWLDSERYDIVAKIPEGATKEQFQLMLQNLLSERFKLKLHRETKDLPIYALVVGKNGVKMKESSKDDPAPDAAGAPPPPSRGPGPGEIRMTKNGMPQLPPGGGRRSIMLMIGGKMRLQANQQPTTAIAEMLGNQLGRPVVDQTGLTGNYDYTLEFVPEGAAHMPGMPGMTPPDGGGAPGTPSANSPDAAGPTLTTAIAEQLGLKLEPKKGPIALLVIDAAEKVPTEN